MKHVLAFAWMAVAMGGMLGGGCYALMAGGDANAGPGGIAIGLAFVIAGLGGLTIAYLLNRDPQP